jgi:hypothetical protein
MFSLRPLLRAALAAICSKSMEPDASSRNAQCDNSPPIHRWENEKNHSEPRKGRLKKKDNA